MSDIELVPVLCTDALNLGMPAGHTLTYEDGRHIERLLAALLELPGVQDVDRAVDYAALYITYHVGEAAEEAIKATVAPYLREPPWQ